MNDLAQLAELIGQTYVASPERKKMLETLNRANPDEISILANLMRIKDTRRFFAEILSGAHVTIFDFGERYDAWRKLKSAGTRRSSHRSDGAQYHVDGPFCHTILFGKRGSLTWLQLEGHPQGIGHVIDWFKYSITGKNQGPYGSSKHVDNQPLAFRPPDKVRTVTQQQQVFR